MQRPLSGTAVESKVTPCPEMTSPINELNVLEEGRHALFCRDRSDTRSEAAFYLLVSKQESCLAPMQSRSAESLQPPGSVVTVTEKARARLPTCVYGS